jgi:hypothetical protein
MVVANLNARIRTLNRPTRQVASVEEDLFGGEKEATFVAAPKGRPRQFNIKRS